MLAAQGVQLAVQDNLGLNVPAGITDSPQLEIRVANMPDFSAAGRSFSPTRRWPITDSHLQGDKARGRTRDVLASLLQS